MPGFLRKDSATSGVLLDTIASTSSEINCAAECIAYNPLTEPTTAGVYDPTGTWFGTVDLNKGCQAAHYSSTTKNCVLYGAKESASNMDYDSYFEDNEDSIYLELLTYSQDPSTTENTCTHDSTYNGDWGIVAACGGFGWRAPECIG
jgi:hypothetical protein